MNDCTVNDIYRIKWLTNGGAWREIAPIDGSTRVEDFLARLTDASVDQARDAITVLVKLGELNGIEAELQENVKQLERRSRCCGNAWRNKGGRLYMHHSKADDCPMHGAAFNGADRGLRSYVRGEDETATLQAAQTYQEWKETIKRLTEATRARDMLAHKQKTLLMTQRGFFE
ncbi:MAG: hypothetical protein GY803_27530 [Chloroflexi bacterium]|nr:hypothetical protein [Chloroflexota bacterium]